MNSKKIYLIYPKQTGVIAPEIYGHFAEHIGGVFYDGLWVGRDSSVPNVKGFRKEIVDRMKAIQAPVVRWPGGCFAEIYDWRDGVGPDRPTRISWWTVCDGKYESNQVGTHEFMDFCEAIGAKGYVAANMTGVSPLHIRNWMDYCLSPRGSTTLAKEREANGHPEPFDIPYWGVGNENWGGGGNMTPEHYANEYRRYVTLLQNAFPKAEFFACGTSDEDFNWGDGVLRGIRDPARPGNAKCPMDGFAVHYYSAHESDPLNFTREEWSSMMHKAAGMEHIVRRNWDMVCACDMQKHAKLVVDEWGCWHPTGSGPSKGANLFEQQSTMRDAMVAALTLNIFNNNCDKVRMANVAQLCNNLHALFLAGGDHCIVTPTYYVYDLYQDHQGARAVETLVTENEDLDTSVSVSASVKDGKTLITLGNLSCTEDAEISLEAVGGNLAEAEVLLLTSEDMHACNTFENPEHVAPRKAALDIRKPFLLPKFSIMAIRFPNEA